MLVHQTASCLTCGMIEGTSYLNLQLCGSKDCCLTPSLHSEGINYLPGQTDNFQVKQLLIFHFNLFRATG